MRSRVNPATKRGSKKSLQPMTSYQTNNSRRCMTRHVTLTRSIKRNSRQIMMISASRTSRTTIGPTRATPTLTIGSRALLAAITGSKVTQTGKRLRRMMESITTFTKTRAATTAAMEAIAMTGAAMLTRLAHSSSRMPKTTSDRTTSISISSRAMLSSKEASRSSPPTPLSA